MSRTASPWLWLLSRTFVLVLVGGSTLVYVVLYHTPTLPARLAFFWALIVTVAGLSLPPLALLHRRLRGHWPSEATLWRESMLAGAFLALWAWLQMDRLAAPGVLMALGLALLFVEGISLLWGGSPRKRI